MNNANYVNISPEELIRVCDSCLNNISNFRNSRVTYTRKQWSWKKFKYIDVPFFKYKSWAAYDKGIGTRLKELRAIAVTLMFDNGVQDKDINLSHTTHTNLYKCYYKDDSFEPDVFGMGY